MTTSAGATEAINEAAPAQSAVVIIASTRAASGVYPDRSGPIIRDWLQEQGFTVTAPRVVADGEAVGEALRQALAERPDVILTSGGTGVSPSDRTPEETAPYLDVEVPGLLEELRRRGTQHIATAILSRGLAGFAGDTFVMNMPGSPGGVRDGLSVLGPVLSHLLGQRHGTQAGRHTGDAARG